MTQPTDHIPLAAAYRVPPDTERAQAIAGLRALAQMLQYHPELPTPYSITAQAGPTGGDWDTQRAVVVDAAAVLGQPIKVDRADTCTVRAELTDRSGPYVAYVVHAVSDEPESAADTSPAAAAAEVPADLAPKHHIYSTNVGKGGWAQECPCGWTNTAATLAEAAKAVVDHEDAS